MDVRKRKRGIRASREKLEAAMIAAGFDTQSELANKMAMTEGIEKPPRDLVSKVFREQAVSTHNLTRVANGLGVETHTIYLTKDDNEFNEIVSTQSLPIANTPSGPLVKPIDISSASLTVNTKAVSAPPKLLINKPKTLLIGLTTVFIIAMVLVWNFDTATSTLEPKTKLNPLKTPLGKVKILIQSPAEISGLANLFNQELTRLDNMSASYTSMPSSYHLSTFEALDNWQVHAVLKLFLTKGRYYQVIAATLSSAERSEIILQSMMRNTELERDHSQMTKNMLAQTHLFIAGELIIPPMTSSQQALELYLRAKNLLFISHSANDFQTILDYLDHAIQLDPRFSQAFAEACRTNVRMSWIKKETALLEKAADYCNTADELNPDNISTLTAKAELWSRTGEIEKAIGLLKPVVDAYPDDADTLAIFANLYLMSEGSNDTEEAANMAEKYAQKAILLAPQHWQAYNTLGNLYFARGKMQEAKNQFVQASKVVKQEVILANLGTLQLCFGELENAKQTYLDIIENFESNYIGYENLGSVYFFEQNFSQALKNKLIAIEKQPDVAIHQVWSGLAEAYLHTGQIEKAGQNYTKALTLIERDELLENVSLSDQLHKLYYQQKLTRLRPDQQYFKDFEQTLNNFISDRSKLGLKARSHLAWLAGEAKQTKNKQLIWQEITQVCPVYEKSPELLAQN